MDRPGAEYASYRVAKGFFWQTPGSVTPYLMATIIFLAFGKGVIVGSCQELRLSPALYLAFAKRTFDSTRKPMISFIDGCG